MQNLLLLNSEYVIIQSNGKDYQDTFDNFLLDIKKNIPKMEVNGKFQDVIMIDYNKETKACWLNNSAFQLYPNEFCEEILSSIDTILLNQATRNFTEPTIDELRQQALDYQGGIYNKEKYAIAWVTRTDGSKIGFDTDLEQNSQTDWNSVRRVLDDLIEAGQFEEGEEPNIPYRYWVNETDKEYAPVTLTELKQAGIISSQQQNAAFKKFEPILKEIRETQDIEVLKKYLPSTGE